MRFAQPLESFGNSIPYYLAATKQKGRSERPLFLARQGYIFYTMYVFEYDERKSQRHLAKHGIDFVEAQSLWNDPYVVEIPARTTDEGRFLVVGKIHGKHGSAIITSRDGNIRLSCRVALQT